MSDQDDNGYESFYDTDTTTEPAEGDELLTVQSDFRSRMKRLEITADESNTFQLKRRDQDGGDSEAIKSYVGDSVTVDYDGEPVAKAGAGKEYVVTVVSGGSADTDYAVNAETEKLQQ